MTHPIISLKAFCGDLQLVEIYDQAITWENLRCAYFTQYGNIPKAMEAARRAQHYMEAYEALPERSHIIKRAFR